MRMRKTLELENFCADGRYESFDTKIMKELRKFWYWDRKDFSTKRRVFDVTACNYTVPSDIYLTLRQSIMYTSVVNSS